MTRFCLVVVLLVGCAQEPDPLMRRHPDLWNLHLRGEVSIEDVRTVAEAIERWEDADDVAEETPR